MQPIKRFVPFAVVLGIIVFGLIARRARMTSPDTIEYRGESIRLTKSYSDYDDYKDDLNNIDPAEIPRVQRLVLEAPVAVEYTSRWDLILATMNVAFPGYGSRQFGDKLQQDGSILSGFGVEIPFASKMRILTFRGRDGHYRLIDDFVESSDWNTARVAEEQAGQLTYYSLDGKAVVTRPIPSK